MTIIPQIKKASVLPQTMGNFYLSYLMKNNKYYCYKCATKDWDNKVMYRILFDNNDLMKRCECCGLSICGV